MGIKASASSYVCQTNARNFIVKKEAAIKNQTTKDRDLLQP